ncbi:MAG TPA: ABC transporter substrate-binding protein, partial [Opitutaceae bacterium]|nr:ABC transporter substrate-binding protein [Opitutaceae bacterium]
MRDFFHQLKQRSILTLLTLFFLGSSAVIGKESALTKIWVQLDWIKNAQFAGVLWAEAQGWYREAGLDVEIHAVDKITMEAIAPVLHYDGIAIGVADGSALVHAKSGGAPIKAFGTMFQASPLGIVTLKSSGLITVASLRGKRIGLHADDRMQLGFMLKHAGLKPQDVTIMEIGDDIHSLPESKIDAQVCYVIDEAIALKTAGHDVNTLLGFENGYQAYSQIYFTTEATWKTRRAVLQKFLEISNRGWRAVLADKPGAAQLIVSRFQPSVSIAYQEASLAVIE